MKAARIVVLAVALGSGLAAAMMVVNIANRPPEAPPPAPVVEAPKVETVDVLVVSHDVQMGATIKAEDLAWTAWPRANLLDAFVTRTTRPTAIEDLQNSIARQALLSGEPVREGRLIKADRGFMSVLLTPGMRAIAVEIKAASSAGGFILPNDRVDVILTRAANKAAPGGDTYTTETILQNIKVLAIDQQIAENRGEAAVVARNTATLELTPRQAETVALAQQVGTIQLVLRPLRDQKIEEKQEDDAGAQKGAVNVVRYGVSSKVSTPR